MAQETLYVVQPFVRDEDGNLIPETPIAEKSVASAKERARRLMGIRAGVIAYSRTGDIDVGEYEDAVVIAKYGEVPENVDPG